MLYPAMSDDGLQVICQRLMSSFSLPPFKTIYHSEYLETAQSALGPFEITVTEYRSAVTAEEAARIGPPDYWNLAWRAAVGLAFNYQVSISRPPNTRNQQRRIARKLREAFTEIKLHGDTFAA